KMLIVIFGKCEGKRGKKQCRRPKALTAGTTR
ncbi:unnamed protein product, partial [marine sediment metagenome]